MADFAAVLKEITSSTIPLADQPVLTDDSTKKKSSKAEANYVKHPVNGNHCSQCTMFETPYECSAVLGTISPEGHCKYFEEAKTSTFKIIKARLEKLDSGDISEGKQVHVNIPIASDDIKAEIEHIAWTTIRRNSEILAGKKDLKLPKEDVPIKKIVATQPYVSEKRVDWHAKKFKKKGKYKQDPITVKYKGKFYILDGHHRVEGAIKSGATEIPIEYIDDDLKSNKILHGELLYKGLLSYLAAQNA